MGDGEASSHAAAVPAHLADTVRIGDAATASPLAALVDFATRLVLEATAPALAGSRQLREAGCHASLFRPVPAGRLHGEAVALHQDEAGSNWQVTIRDPAGEAIATIGLSYVLSARPAEVFANAREAVEAGEPVAKEAVARPGGLPAAGLRRDLIAAAAAEVIARKGFASATMREIADAAGMHVPTMYQYVASKDAMLELVYGHIMAQVRIDAAEAAAHFETASDRLRATIAALVDKGDRYRRGIGVLNRELKSLSPEARRRVLADYAKLIGQLADLIAEGVESGEFRPVNPVIAANFVEATCDIWPLRQFAVQRFGQAAFRAEVEELILGSLRAPDAGGR